MNLRQPEPEAPEPEPTDTAVVTLISDDYYRFDDIYNYSYESVTGSSYTERGVGNQNRVHYATGEGEAGLNSQSHSWYLETLSVDEDETIDAYTESGVTNTTTGVRNTSESLRSYEGPLSENTIMISRFNSLTGFTSTENQFSFAHTVASKPPKVVNQQTGELEADPAADADGYVYEMSTGSSASILESGTTNYQTQETYQYYKITEPEPDISETRKTQNAWSNGIESYYLAAGGGTTVVNDLVTSTSYSRYDIPFSTGFSTYDSNSTSSSGDDSTTSVSHVESTTTETMTSGSTAKSRSGKDDQGRPFADSRNHEQFDRLTTELTIDYGHLIDKEGSHELPTFYDNETFEAINYESNAISSTSFSLTNGARNSQSQYERTTSDGYSTTKNGTGQNRSFEIVTMNTDGQVGLDIAFGSYNQSSAFWHLEDETRTNNGRVDQHSKEDSYFNQTARNFIYEFTQQLTDSPGTYVNSVSGTKTATLTSYVNRDVYLSNYAGGKNEIHLKDGYEVGSQEDITYQMKQVEDPGSAGGPNNVTLQPSVTVDTDYSFGGDFEGTGTIDTGGTVNWTSVTSEARSNGNVTPDNSDWDASLTLEDYLGSGFGGTFAYIPVDAPYELHNLWQDEFQAPILDGLQQVDPHTPEHAGGRSNDTQFVSEQSNGNHNTNYQFNGAYQNLDPNTTIDFETPWGPLSSFKNTEVTSSSEPASEPTAGEGTEGDGCDCACGEVTEGRLIERTEAHALMNDNDTPDDTTDDYVVGYVEYIYYKGNETPIVRNLDKNGEYRGDDWQGPIDYNYMVLVMTSDFSTDVSSTFPEHNTPSPGYQIPEVANEVNNYGTIGKPSFAWSLVPFYGSGRTSIDDFQQGKWGWGSMHAVFAISDIFLIKSIVTSGGKLVFKGGNWLLQRGGKTLGIVSDDAAEAIVKGTQNSLDNVVDTVENVQDINRCVAPTHIGAKTWQEYESGVRALYGEASFSSRQYTAIVDGKLVNGVADNVASIGGRNVAVEAKFAKDWSKSLRNPTSAIGNKPFAVAEQAKMLEQARKYSAGFPEVIYHSNSPELIAHYTKVFRDAGLTNVRFVLTQ